MPELPEVETVRRVLFKWVKDRVIKDVKFRDRFIETFAYKDDEGQDKEGFDYTSMQFKEAFAGNRRFVRPRGDRFR